MSFDIDVITNTTIKKKCISITACELFLYCICCAVRCDDDDQYHHHHHPMNDSVIENDASVLSVT